jgi:glutathione S-transferase
MKQQYRLYGAQVSHFTGKLRGYLNYKSLEYQEKVPTIYDMLNRFPKKVGASVMPVIETRGGEWLADTTEIIEELETRHPSPSIRPTTPRQTIAAMLFEAWCDDFWMPVSLHTRWSYPENYPLFRSELGKGFLPFAPGFLQNYLVDKTAASKMRDALVRMGVVPEQFELLDRWIHNMLDMLEQHFSQHGYLFGGRPTIADYGLLGSMYGHLSRDPWPKRELIAPRPNLKAYIERLHRGDSTGYGASGELPADDEIPATLLPIFELIFREFYPLLAKTVDSVNEFIEEKGLQKGDKLPRMIKRVTFPMGDGEYTRFALTYPLWMMQRIQKHLRQLPDSDRASVKEWFASMSQADLAEMDFGPDLERVGLGVRLAI